MTYSRRLQFAVQKQATTYFGACPTNPGGSSLAAATTVVTKWGSNKPSIRQFQGATLVAPNHPVGCSVVHTSYKPDEASVLSGALDAQIEALVAATPAGDIIEFWHESDNDGLTGSQITDRIAMKNRLYDIKQTIKPSVLVAATMTGGFFASYTSESTRQLWYGLRGDLVGVDCDGVHDGTGPTYDMTYLDERGNALNFMTINAANGWVGWTVPEMGTSRQPWDTDGTARAAWFGAQLQMLKDRQPYAVMLYDYNTSAHNLPDDYNAVYAGTSEFDVWQEFISANP